MDDYIKREDALEQFDYYDLGEYLTTQIRGMLMDIPPADVAPVVRCKDCRHAVDYYHEGDCYCSNPKWGLNYFGGSWEFYCADAERKDDD